MKLEGDYKFDASVPEVWSALFDPVILAAVMPGCEKLDLVDGSYIGEIKVKVGPIQGKFTGKVDLTDKDEPRSYKMTVDGRGAPGFVKAVATVKLEPDGDGTRVFYDTDAQIGGKIASVGQRLIDASARAIVAQSLEGLHTNIKLRAQAYREAGVAPEAAAAPAAGDSEAAAVAAEESKPAAEAKPAETVEATSAEATSAEATSADATSADAKPADAKSVGAVDAKPVDAKPADAKPADAKPADAKPADAKPADGDAAADARAAAAEARAAATEAKAAAAAAKTAAAKPATAPAFTPVKVKQSDLANAVAKEVASSMFPRSVLVAIILIQALIIVWLLLRH